jgi:hypothetical protein
MTAALLMSCGSSDDSRRHRPAGSGSDSRKPLAWGHEQTIYVFADDRVWHFAEQHLRESIERYYFTTENETYFDLKRGDFESLQHFFRFKNLIFLGHLDSEEKVSQYVRERLTATVINSVEENGVGMFTRHNLWANDQLVLFMLGNTEENLLTYNMLQAEAVFEQFRAKFYERTEHKVYGLEIYPAGFFRDFPWSMKIPENYIIYKRDDAGNFISFLARRREQPDRYLSVYYEEMAVDNVTLEWVRNTRARLAWECYDEDEFAREDTRSYRIDFAGREVIKFSGRWQNRKHAVGGAFQSFAFYDERSNRAYLIDNSVFYPEGFKLPALIELEVISRTISLSNDNDKES